LRARLPGAGVRRAARQAGEKAQRARAAVAKYRERRAAGGRNPHDPWAKHTDKSLRKAKKDAAGLHDRWHGGAPGKGAGQGQPALARAGGGGGGATTHPIGRPGMMKMAGEAGEGNIKPTLKENIKKAIPPGSRKLSNPAVTSKKVGYNKFDLSKKVVEYRQANGLMDSEGNLAVIEYTHNGVKGWEIGESEFNGPHSEESAWGKLFGEGINPKEVERIYTERAPCDLPGHACGRWMKSVFPDAKVFHSFEYGATKASRDAGNEALKLALQNIREGK